MCHHYELIGGFDQLMVFYRRSDISSPSDCTTSRIQEFIVLWIKWLQCFFFFGLSCNISSSDPKINFFGFFF